MSTTSTPPSNSPRRRPAPTAHPTWSVASCARRSRPYPPSSAASRARVGAVLAEPLTATTPFPPFDASAMDGWAVAGPGPWIPQDDAIAAGMRSGALVDGQARRIATGARLPDGTQRVIRDEEVDATGDLVYQCACGPPARDDTRRSGSEWTAGALSPRPARGWTKPWRRWPAQPASSDSWCAGRSKSQSIVPVTKLPPVQQFTTQRSHCCPRRPPGRPPPSYVDWAPSPTPGRICPMIPPRLSPR